MTVRYGEAVRIATVKFYDTSRGYGFLKTNDGDLFFHATGLSPSLGIPQQGDEVAFDVGSNRRNGRMEAQNVRPA